jgi:ABC-type phosphate transport system ATPase subunit
MIKNQSVNPQVNFQFYHILSSIKTMPFTYSQGFKWSIGAIIGPSGSGMTTILKHFGEGRFGDIWVQQHSF